MDRTQLEDRIRASLQSRADDVTPTPALWERVAARTTRVARWRVGLWALAGSAAVVVLVLGALTLLDRSQSVQIDPVQSETPTGPTEPTPSQSATGAPVAPGGPATVVTTDGSAVYEVDPATGEVRHELDVFADMAEGGTIGDVAVRPGSDADRLVVATTMAVEGMSWEIQVTTFGPDRSVVDNFFLRPVEEQGPFPVLDPLTDQTRAFPPTLAWNRDGGWLAWARGEEDGVTLSGLDWGAAQAEPDQVLPETIGAVDATRTPEPYLRVQDWIGDPGAVSTLWLTGPTGGGDVAVDVCLPEGPCGDEGPRTIGMEGGTVLDVDHLGTGTTLALVIRSSTTQDAEGATLEVVADPMSDQQRTIPVPEGTFPNGTAAPIEGWLDAAGDRLVVGFGELGGSVVTLGGQTVEELQVAGSAPLPDGTTAASVATAAVAAPPEAEPTREPTTAAATPDPAPTVELSRGQRTTSPDGHSIEVDTLQVVGGVEDAVADPINAELTRRVDDAVGQFDDRVASSNPQQPPELTATVEVVAAEGLLSVHWHVTEYTGGANTNSHPIVGTWDLATGDPVTFGDVFVPGSRAELVPRVVDALQRQHDLDDQTVEQARDSLEADPSLLETITTDGAGVTFHFAEYEVGPGALGAVSASLPADQLADLYRDGGPLPRAG